MSAGGVRIARLGAWAITSMIAGSPALTIASARSIAAAHVESGGVERRARESMSLKSRPP